MGQRADVEDGLQRIDELGKAGLDLAAVDMAHLAPAGRRRLQRMQHDEAGAVGDEVGLRRRRPPSKASEPSLDAGDARVIDEALPGIGAGARDR